MFNVYTSPPGSPPHCQTCGDMPRLMQRPDDKEEVISKRLEVFEAQTKPLIKHYEAGGLLRVVDADADVETVFKRIERAVTGSAVGLGKTPHSRSETSFSPISSRRHPASEATPRSPMASAFSSPRGARISALTPSSAARASTA